MFGVSSIGKKVLSQTKPNDLLIFYLLSPIDRIIAVCRVKSKIFKDKTDFWGSGRYPYRIKTELVKEFKRNIPLNRLLGKRNDEEEFEIVPYFRGIEIMEITLTKKNEVIDDVEDNSNALNILLKFLSEKG